MQAADKQKMFLKQQPRLRNHNQQFLSFFSSNINDLPLPVRRNLAVKRLGIGICLG